MYTKKKYDALVKEAARQIREANMEVAKRGAEILELKEVIRELCYRGERRDGTPAYYDWCCEYCARSTECLRHPRCWCGNFEVCIE